MKRNVRLFESHGHNLLVLSAKSSSVLRTVQVNRLIARTFDYPIHLGLTHAGLPEDARIASAVTLGTLLFEGIGDTVRVSMAGDPVKEIEIAKRILIALGLYGPAGPQLIVCPTCARAQVDVVALAKKVKKALKKIRKPVRIAVMGCIVNGPGEAADADLAICVAGSRAWLYRKGRRTAVLRYDKILPALIKELEHL